MKSIFIITVMKHTVKEVWFEWKKDKWQRMENKPERAGNCINFGIG